MFLRADVAQIVERGVIARQQKMIAVVDGHAERGVVIGTAAAAGERGCFVHNHALAARRQLKRGGQSGKAGADDVDRPGMAKCITRDYAAR